MEREASPGRAVGRLLRDQREARGLTIKAVEMALRIRLQHLEAIEQGRFDLLPGAAGSRGCSRGRQALNGARAAGCRTTGASIASHSSADGQPGQAIPSGLSDTARRKILSENARRFYRL